MPDNTLFNPQMMLGMGGAAFAQRHPAYAQQRPGLGQGGAPSPTPAPGTPAPAPAPGTPAHQGHPHAGAQQWADLLQQFHNPDGGFDGQGLQTAMGDWRNAVSDWWTNRPNVLAGGGRNPAYFDWKNQHPNIMNYLHPQAPGTPATPGTPAPPGTPPLTNPGTQVGPVNALPQMGNVGSSYGVIGANPAANPYGLPTY